MNLFKSPKKHCIFVKVAGKKTVNLCSTAESGCAIEVGRVVAFNEE